MRDGVCIAIVGAGLLGCVNESSNQRAQQSTGTCSAQGSATMTDLVGATPSEARAINTVGQVTGEAMSPTGYSHGALWDLASSTVVDLGTEDFIFVDLTTVGRSINDSGIIVGDGRPYWTGLSFPFYRLPSDGVLQSLLDPFGSYDYVYGINGAGQMVGYGPADAVCNPGGLACDRAIYWPGGSAPFVNLGDPEGGFYSHAAAINDAGQIAGFANTADGERATVWTTSGSAPVHLGVLPGGTASRATSINRQGDVAGFSTVAGGARHAFVAHAGQLTDLGTLPGGHESMALGINAAGHVVGWSDDASFETHAVVWGGGIVLDLGQSGATSTANAINESDQVVGFSEGLGLAHHAVLWNVTLAVKTPPTLTVSPATQCIWPPDHAMQCFELGVAVVATATDDCDPTPTVQVESVTSNQPDNGVGDGNTSGDVSWTANGFCVRRERSATLGARTYTATIEASDQAGNTATEEVTVVVPEAGCP